MPSTSYDPRDASGELGTRAKAGTHAADMDQKDVSHNLAGPKDEHLTPDLDLGMQFLEQLTPQGEFEIGVLRFDATAWRDPVGFATRPRALDRHEIAILVERERPHALIGSQDACSCLKSQVVRTP